ncbi:xylan 1,4-beta-xylosidase [Nonomuraea sp. NN258]|uniref:xylan 1,4-beta-xylosidase n=1 Tax=Nonomuraea antri TaxID=2730852 RepID=UPI001569FC99|nr:xylan 1,4-beta-xylosidase [Nonomuraea antri]NRQ38749.1 xylan 1,4-beta-xylosidase [Nonomuraea antri]
MGSDNGGSRRRRFGRALAAVAGAAALTLVMASCSAADPGAEGTQTVRGTSGGTAPAETGTPEPGKSGTGKSETGEPPKVADGWPRFGLTHTGVSANNVTQQFEQVVAGNLAKTPMLQNQHIMGFGALNPQPRKQEFYWEDLDSRMNLMKLSGGTPIITLCCAPDWMKGGPEGPTTETGWRDHLEDAPYPKHFDDFAKLSATVAQRYKNVKYFMVWNEFKGFWKNHNEPADFKGYTEMYNKVYDAVKAVRPDALIGGPYLGFDSHETGESELRGDWGVVSQHAIDAFQYWNKNKKGADFIVVDGASVTDSHKLIPDEFGALSKFSDVTAWLRKESGDLPVWWSEWYFVPEDGTTWPEPKRLAVQAASMIEFARSGAATALYWNPQAKEGACNGCMWHPTNGSQLPTGKLVADFATWFPADAKLEKVETSDSKIRVLAQAERMVMVNTSNASVSATVDGKDVTLKAYEIKWSDR